MSNRYYTPLKYTDGNGNERRTKVYFELDPIELMDWVLENEFEANELLASISELQEVEQGESRDLTRDEIRTLLGVMKILSRLSAGRPTEDGEYFIKDPNWTSSYAYRGFREFLLTNPKEMNSFLETLLDDKVMDRFVTAINEAEEKSKVEKLEKKSDSDSGPETIERMRTKLRELEEKNQSNN